MSTRRDQFNERPNAQAQGYEGTDSPNDIEIPSCTIEDVDRSVFNLFDKQLPLQAKESTGIKKIPGIFATGERFAVLRRKEPLRDKGGALILPLVSIMRTGVSQNVDHGIGPGQGAPITITKRISKESQIYKQLKNRHGLRNQDGMAHSSHNATDKGDGTEPGSVGTRREGVPRDTDSRAGMLLKPHMGGNIYETITIPPVKFYTATYDITLWSQYTQEMNDMLMTIMSLYQNNHQRTFKLETDKGYWFVGFVDSELSPDNNADDFTDDERLIRYSFSMKVAGYIIAPEYPGAPSYIRRTISSPEISFSMTQPKGNFKVSLPPGVPRRNDPDMHILKDLYSEFTPMPAVGTGQNTTAAALAAVDSQEPSSDDKGSEGTASLGGFESQNSNNSAKIITTTSDPFTGEKVSKVLRIKSTNQRKGETVLREELIFDFGDLFKVK
jgi:hypothetical protein